MCVCVGHEGGLGSGVWGLRWAGGTNQSNKTMCMCVRGVRGPGLGWAGGTNLSKKTMYVFVGGGVGSGAEMGRKYQPIKENSVCCGVGGRG